MKLDIGCGTPQQKKQGYYGIDLNPEYQPDLIWDCNNGLPFDDDSIDAIYTNNAIEHFYRHGHVLEECFRVLKPGCELELILPNMQYFPLWCLAFFNDEMKIWNAWMNSKWKKERTRHTVMFTPETAKIVLEMIGFEIVEVKGFHLAKEFTIKAKKPLR